MQTASDPNASASNLKDMIMTDQSFAAKILKLVNSPYYGFSGKITTITHAIVVLGFSTVRNLALSLGVGKGITAVKGPSALDLDAFWSHSVATACAASVIGRRKSLSAKVLEEVFIGGLLHDLGKLFLSRYFNEEYTEVLRSASAESSSALDAEVAIFGVGHTSVGKQLADKWNLPAATVAMIAYHHDPDQANDLMISANIVHAADYLARKLGIGNAGGGAEPVLTPDVEMWLNFLPNTWDAIEQDTLQKYAGASTLLQAMVGK